MKRFLILLAIIAMAFPLMAGCATNSDTKTDIGIDVAKMAPEKARFAGMIFAWHAPGTAFRLQKGCAVVSVMTDKESIVAYLQDKLTDKYFSDMTDDEKKVTQEFISSMAADVGIDIDFGLSNIIAGDGFDLGHFQETAAAVCDGMRIGLQGSPL